MGNKILPEEMELVLEKTERRMCAMPGEKCSYCLRKLPDASIGNPQWLHKRMIGKSVKVYCSATCLDWSRFVQQANAIRSRMMTTKADESVIEERIEKMKAEFLDKYIGLRNPDPREVNVKDNQKPEPITTEEPEATVTETEPMPTEELEAPTTDHEPMTTEEPTVNTESSPAKSNKKATGTKKPKQQKLQLCCFTAAGNHGTYTVDQSGMIRFTIKNENEARTIVMKKDDFISLADELVGLGEYWDKVFP